MGRHLPGLVGIKLHAGLSDSLEVSLLGLSESNAEIQYKPIQDVGKKIVIVYEANSHTKRISIISTVPHTPFPISLSGEFQTKNQNESHKMNDNKQRVLHA